MFKYMLAFAAGYWFGSGGKLPPKPNITTGPDGSIIIGPPTDPGTQTYYPPSTTGGGMPSRSARYSLPGSYGYPAGSTYDAQGNIYGPNGQLIFSGQGLVNNMPNPNATLVQ